MTARSVFALAVSLSVALPAAAREAPRVEMDPLGLYLPVGHASFGYLGRPFHDGELRLMGSWRGGRVGPSARVGHLTVSTHLALDDLDVRSLRAVLVPWRTVGESQPVPGAWDVHWLPITVGHVPELGVDQELAVDIVSAEAGLYLPAVLPGDMDARLVGRIGLLGARHHAYLSPDLASFIGARIGGVGGEFSVGNRVLPPLIVGALVAGEVDWSLGRSDGLSLVTLAEVELMLHVTLRHGARLAVGLEYDNLRDNGQDLVRSTWHGVAELRVPY